jgi:hypothetical protein
MGATFTRRQALLGFTVSARALLAAPAPAPLDHAQCHMGFSTCNAISPDENVILISS